MMSDLKFFLWVLGIMFGIPFGVFALLGLAWILFPR